MKIELTALEQVCVTESEKKLKLSPKKLIRAIRYKIVLKDTESSTKIRIRPQDTGPSTEILVRPQRCWSVHRGSDLFTKCKIVHMKTELVPQGSRMLILI